MCNEYAKILLFQSTVQLNFEQKQTKQTKAAVHLKNSNGLSMVLVILHIDNVNLDSIRYQNSLASLNKIL